MARGAVDRELRRRPRVSGAADSVEGRKPELGRGPTSFIAGGAVGSTEAGDGVPAGKRHGEESSRQAGPACRWPRGSKEEAAGVFRWRKRETSGAPAPARECGPAAVRWAGFRPNWPGLRGKTARPRLTGRDSAQLGPAENFLFVFYLHFLGSRGKYDISWIISLIQKFTKFRGTHQNIGKLQNQFKFKQKYI